MNTFRRVLGALAVVIALPLCNAQIWDGRVMGDTASTVAGMTGYPYAVVSAAIPQASVTGFVEGTGGITLLGGNLGNTITLSAAGLAGYQVTWSYSVIKLADNSGFTLVLDVTVTLTAPGNSLPTSMRKIMLDPAGMQKNFRHRQYWTSVALYTTPYFYDWMYRNFQSPVWNMQIGLYPGDYRIYQNQLSRSIPDGIVTIGPAVVVGGGGG